MFASSICTIPLLSASEALMSGEPHSPTRLPNTTCRPAGRVCGRPNCPNTMHAAVLLTLTLVVAVYGCDLHARVEGAAAAGAAAAASTVLLRLPRPLSLPMPRPLLSQLVHLGFLHDKGCLRRCSQS